jgi:hypothetical protein
MLTITALAAIDPAFQTQLPPTPPQPKPIKPHQMERPRSVMQSPPQKVRRINQPSARGPVQRNVPCQRK